MSFLEEALLGGAVSTQGSFFGLSWLQPTCNTCWCPIVFILCSGLPLWRINKNDKEQPSSLFNFPMKQYLLFVLLIFYVPGIPLALSVLSQPTCCSSSSFLIATCCCMAVSLPSLAINSSFVAFSDSFFPSVVLLFILSLLLLEKALFLHTEEKRAAATFKTSWSQLATQIYPFENVCEVMLLPFVKPFSLSMPKVPDFVYANTKLF